MNLLLLFNLFFAFFLVFLNGFFVAAEFALVKVRPTRVEELAREGIWLARLVRTGVTHLDEYLSATQLGITIASLGLGWIGESTFSTLLFPLLNWLGQWAPPVTHSISATLAFILITFLHIVFGELAPKSLAIARSETTALAIILPLVLFYKGFYPIIWLFNSTAIGVLKLLGLRPPSEQEMIHSEEELRMILIASGKHGLLTETEVELLEHVFIFTDRMVREVMTPRVDIIYLSTERPWEENLKIAQEYGFTRYPVCEENLDQVLGYVHIRDLFSLQKESSPDLRRILRPLMMVPETKRVERLLREFQTNQTPIALVLDEYGGTAGLVTLHDVLEELVGFLPEEYGQKPPPIQKVPEGYIVEGGVLLEDLRESLHLPVETEEFETIGGYVMGLIGTIPRPGEEISVKGFRIKVLEVRARRVCKVLLIPPPKEEE